jgi:hypothetical protein
MDSGFSLREPRNDTDRSYLFPALINFSIRFAITFQ